MMYTEVFVLIKKIELHFFLVEPIASSLNYKMTISLS